MVEVSLVVGKLDASLALLLTKDHHLIEFPTILLPDGISTGSIVKITCERDTKQEEIERQQFNQLQEEIFEVFGKHEPENPVLKTVNVTQTSCVLEWEPLNLGTSELKELTLYKNGVKLGPIKNPFQRKNIKFSGLPVDTPYKFQLKLETSSGVYYSNTVELRTHKMTDLSGITVCIGDIDYSKEKFSFSDITNLISSIGAKDYSTQVKVDTTQFICTKDSGIEYQKAKNMNIPIIRPEWLKACQLERRIVGVNKFYLDTENPIWKAKDFWEFESNGSVNSTKEDETVNQPISNVENNQSIPNIVIHDDQQINTPEEATPEEPVVDAAQQVDPVEEVDTTAAEEPIEEPNVKEIAGDSPVEEKNEPEETHELGETEESEEQKVEVENLDSEEQATETFDAVVAETNVEQPIEQSKVNEETVEEQVEELETPVETVEEQLEESETPVETVEEPVEELQTPAESVEEPVEAPTEEIVEESAQEPIEATIETPTLNEEQKEITETIEPVETPTESEDPETTTTPTSANEDKENDGEVLDEVDLSEETSKPSSSGKKNKNKKKNKKKGNK